jgi:hypothetical protein
LRASSSVGNGRTRQTCGAGPCFVFHRGSHLLFWDGLHFTCNKPADRAVSLSRISHSSLGMGGRRGDGRRDRERKRDGGRGTGNRERDAPRCHHFSTEYVPRQRPADRRSQVHTSHRPTDHTQDKNNRNHRQRSSSPISQSKPNLTSRLRKTRQHHRSFSRRRDNTKPKPNHSLFLSPFDP